MLTSDFVAITGHSQKVRCQRLATGIHDRANWLQAMPVEAPVISTALLVISEISNVWFMHALLRSGQSRKCKNLSVRQFA
jgi:hypothetical protein